jgi:hypothetical protein
MDDLTERVRRRAYQMWLDEGRPEGREAAHWDMASELVAIEDGQTKTTKPVERDPDDAEIAATPVEPAAPAAAMGELPTITDVGEQTYPPARVAEKLAGPAPLAKESNAPAPAASKPAATPSAKPAVSSGAQKGQPARTSRSGSARK